MHHSTDLIATIAVGLAYAFVFGYGAARLRLPPLLGYLLAGVVVGPFTPGFVADATLAPQLAEIGVILLMFGVGMHFSIADLLAVRRVAVPGAIGQIAVATVLGAGLALSWGWKPGSALLLGLALSVASTVVLLRALTAVGRLQLIDGQIAVGWLVVEDMFTVVALVVLPSVAPLLGGHALEGEHAGPLLAFGLTMVRIVAFVALMMIVGSRVLPWMLERVVRTGSRELFTLAVLCSAMGIAFAAADLFGLSFALGAFFAGVMVRGSDHGHRAEDEARPLQDLFAALFFVSVGMLFDPSVLIEAPLRVLAVLAVIVVGKSVAAFLIVRAFGHGRSTALTVAAGLAQIGEFSFILATLGEEVGLLDRYGVNLILAGGLLSILLNPFAFRLIRLAGK
jgi:CPA2 family monovalent cation:H+ antiporter-2